MEEFEHNLADESVQAVLATLELESSDVWMLFRLLDADESTKLDLNEFVRGCLQLKGNARSIDLGQLMYEHRRMAGVLHKFMRFTESEFTALHKFMHFTEREFQVLSRQLRSVGVHMCTNDKD